jgi:Flp pilus assembly protein TadD
MTRATTFSLLLGIGLSAAAPAAFAQVATARGKVVDEAGKPVADVKIEMEFKGESRVKVVKSTVTDKKGGYVRAGLPGGNFRMTFTKDGYKTYGMDIYISLGGFSEVPDVVLHPGAAAAATPGKPAPQIEAVLPADDPESSKISKAYGPGVEALKAGRLDEAETLFKEVIAKSPDLAGAHYNLAYIYQQRKDWKSAEAEYLKVAELQPTKSDAVIALSACRELDGRGPEAVEGLLKAAPAFEQDARFLYALGLTASNTGRTKESGDAFRKLQALDPANPESYFHLGTMLVGENKVPDALVQLEKYVSMTGQDAHNLEIAKGLLLALKKK